MKFSKGSVVLWVIVAAVIVVAAAGFVLYKVNKSGDIIPVPVADITPEVSNVTNQPAVVNSVVSSLANLNCGNIFPTDIVDQAYPSLSFRMNKSAASSATVLSCAYDSGKMVGKVLNLYSAMIIVHPPDLQICPDTLACYQLSEKTRSEADPASYNAKTKFSCVASDVGRYSSACTTTLTSPKDHKLSEITFVTSNNKYVVVMSFSAPIGSGQDTSQIAERMAKEADSKISAL